MSDRPISHPQTYRGDHRHLLECGPLPIGPLYDGELMWPVTAVYDAYTDRTEVCFTHVPPVEAGVA